VTHLGHKARLEEAEVAVGGVVDFAGVLKGKVRAPDTIAYGTRRGIEGLQSILFVSQGVKGEVEGSLCVLDDGATSLHDHRLVLLATLGLLVGKKSGFEGIGVHGHVVLFDYDPLGLNQPGQLNQRPYSVRTSKGWKGSPSSSYPSLGEEG